MLFSEKERKKERKSVMNKLEFTVCKCYGLGLRAHLNSQIIEELENSQSAEFWVTFTLSG